MPMALRQRLILESNFATYVIDLEELTISLFHATIRGEDGIWCEETPVLGMASRHVTGKSGKHYYIQFPFVADSDFNIVWADYYRRRLTQIRELKNDT
jgi:hypothetical protein